jgi:hypothetical protein
MPSTLQALAVTLLAILPGAAYTFTFERFAGAYGVKLSDRAFRFLAASAIFHALASAPEYLLYRNLIQSRHLQDGRISLWIMESLTVSYVAIPIILGALIGYGRQSGWLWARMISGRSLAPRAWDHLFATPRSGYIRAKLKSGAWVGGFYGKNPKGLTSYAAGYPEAQDILIARCIELDAQTGAYILESGRPKETGTALLLKWEELELLEFEEMR